MNGICARDGAEALERQDTRQGPGLHRSDKAHEIIPAGANWLHGDVPHNDRLENVRHRHLSRHVQSALPRSPQARTKVTVQGFRDPHAEGGKTMGVDRHAFELGARTLTDHAFDRRARLSLHQHNGLIINQGPLVEFVRVDSDAAPLPSRIGSCAEEVTRRIQAHRIGRCQSPLSPELGDRVLANKSHTAVVARTQCRRVLQ